MKLRVLIAEDERLSREHLRRLLELEPLVEIVGECATGPGALQEIQQNRPDVVLLDVRLPDLDGFGVIRSLAGGAMPAIIFVTGSEQFALQAFEVGAADYLLKPFDRERLQKSLQRVRQQLAPGPQDLSQKQSHRNPDRLTIKSNGRISIVKTAEVDWISAADNYVEIHLGKTSHLMRATIGSITEFLPRNFARISRSTLVNVDRVKEIHSQAHGDYLVILSNGVRLRGSRTFRANFRELLESCKDGS